MQMSGLGKYQSTSAVNGISHQLVKDANGMPYVQSKDVVSGMCHYTRHNAKRNPNNSQINKYCTVSRQFKNALRNECTAMSDVQPTKSIENGKAILKTCAQEVKNEVERKRIGEGEENIVDQNESDNLPGGELKMDDIVIDTVSMNNGLIIQH